MAKYRLEHNSDELVAKLTIDDDGLNLIVNDNVLLWVNQSGRLVLGGQIVSNDVPGIDLDEEGCIRIGCDEDRERIAKQWLEDNGLKAVKKSR